MIWGFVRLTAKPRYLLMLHRCKKKSHTVTAPLSVEFQLTLETTLVFGLFFPMLYVCLLLFIHNFFDSSSFFRVGDIECFVSQI